MSEDLTPSEHVDIDEQKAAEDPNVGEGSPDTAPKRVPDVSLLERQPAAILGVATAIADALIVAAVPLPEWARTILVVVVTVAAALGVRARVTPVADPKLDGSTPLVVS